MLRMAAEMCKDKKDVCGTGFIKNSDGEKKVKEREVRDTWREYFSTVLNEEYSNEFEDVDAVEGPNEDITLHEVQRAIQDMKNRRAPGPSGMSNDMIKLAGETAARELHRII